MNRQFLLGLAGHPSFPWREAASNLEGRGLTPSVRKVHTRAHWRKGGGDVRGWSTCCMPAAVWELTLLI